MYVEVERCVDVDVEMYSCMVVYMYRCVYTCMHVYMYVQILYICTYICIVVCMYIQMYVYTYRDACIDVWLYLYSVYRYYVRGAKSNRNRNANRAHQSQQNRKRGIAAICV